MIDFNGAIAAVTTLIASVLVFVVAWSRKKQEKPASQADAAETALRAVEMASKQLIETQRELYEERSKRQDLEVRFDEMAEEIKRLKERMRRLEAQVISLGGDPVK